MDWGEMEAGARSGDVGCFSGLRSLGGNGIWKGKKMRSILHRYEHLLLFLAAFLSVLLYGDPQCHINQYPLIYIQNGKIPRRN